MISGKRLGSFGPIGAVILAAAAAAVLLPLAGRVRTPVRVKIGFLVKQPEEPWFQNEWKFAEQAGAEHGFDIIKIGATDGERVLNGIDSVAAQGGTGFIICAPDVMLGPAIVSKAAASGLKVMSVDDRFVGADGTPIDSVPHMGISSTSIGIMVGETLMEQLRFHGWNPAETGAISISYYGLQTAKERNEGAISVLIRENFPADRIFDSPQTFPLDVESGYNAARSAITKHPEIKHWLIFGINDETVLGGVRAAENLGFGVDDAVAVGIGGQATALTEFSKSSPTAFYATVAISSKRHGYETALHMWNWITEGIEPEKLIYTTGMLMTRANADEVLAEMGLPD
ncbi:MAG: substrate-binding domain-containing protein [Deltaproteobacteria bacterium]|nr:substrate-binding domain-containing protein [Deltaproteobacteria bacterium]